MIPKHLKNVKSKTQRISTFKRFHELCSLPRLASEAKCKPSYFHIFIFRQQTTFSWDNLIEWDKIELCFYFVAQPKDLQQNTSSEGCCCLENSKHWPSNMELKIHLNNWFCKGQMCIFNTTHCVQGTLLFGAWNSPWWHHAFRWLCWSGGWFIQHFLLWDRIRFS